MATIEENQLAALNRITATPGTYVINDAVAFTDLKFYAFYVAEDTVVSSLSVNGGANNVVADYISTPATPLKGGVIISCRQGHFSGITLTSGSVSLILLPNTLQ